MYPIAHHDWMREHLGHEAISNPRWSEFLQGGDTSDDRRHHLDEEIRLADLVIVPSSFTKETFVSVGVPAAKIVCASLGADLALGELASSNASTVSPQLHVFFAGQVNQRKGIGYLLEAIAQLDSRAVKLSIAGPASAAMCKVIAREYPNVLMMGTMSRPELVDRMASADVLVLPSLAEGFGLVALEAMAVGTPAVVTPRTFGADLIEHGVNGWIVPTADATELARALRRINEDRESLQLVSANARETARDYSWDSYARRVCQHLEKTVSRDRLTVHDAP